MTVAELPQRKEMVLVHSADKQASSMRLAAITRQPLAMADPSQIDANYLEFISPAHVRLSERVDAYQEVYHVFPVPG